MKSILRASLSTAMVVIAGWSVLGSAQTTAVSQEELFAALSAKGSFQPTLPGSTRLIRSGCYSPESIEVVAGYECEQDEESTTCYERFFDITGRNSCTIFGANDLIKIVNYRIEINNALWQVINN